MANVIAIAGKGGVGKTTLGGLLIQTMCAEGRRPILAVDADANSNLNEVLGVDVEMTLGDVRENVLHDAEALGQKIPSGMTKADYTEMMLQRCLAEDDDFDLLVMGRSQGQGCYCYVNGLLQAQLAKLIPNYKYVVVDNEAGMEHISRGILPKVDIMLLVSDCSRRGVQAAERISELIEECHMKPKMIGLIINRAPNGQLNDGTREEIEKSGLTLLGVVPQDEQVYEYDCEGKPTSSLPEDSPVRLALLEIMKKINLAA